MIKRQFRIFKCLGITLVAFGVCSAQAAIFVEADSVFYTLPTPQTRAEKEIVKQFLNDQVLKPSQQRSSTHALASCTTAGCANCNITKMEEFPHWISGGYLTNSYNLTIAATAQGDSCTVPQSK